MSCQLYCYSTYALTCILCFRLASPCISCVCVKDINSNSLLVGTDNVREMNCDNRRFNSLYILYIYRVKLFVMFVIKYLHLQKLIPWNQFMVSILNA